MHETETITGCPVSTGADTDEHVASVRPMSVCMVDLLPTVPYYTGHLCSGLGGVERDLQVSLAATTYSHDREFFARHRLTRAPGLVDFSAHLPSFLKPLRRVLKAFECIVNLFLLAVRFSIRRPDVVHVQFLPMLERGVPFEAWFVSYVRRLGSKLVYTVHNVLPHDSGKRLKAAYARIYDQADALICHDEHLKHRIVNEFGIDTGKVSVIPHGVLFEETASTDTQAAKRSRGIGADEILVLWQGIIRPYKGVGFLLDAWKSARNQGLRGRLLIVGTGDAPELAAIRAKVEQLGLTDSVILDFRFVDVDELASLYAAADILAYPYSAISTSGALMTGIAHAKAIVASTLPGFQQVLEHERNALLVTHGDTKGWADAIIRLANNPQLRQQFGNRLRASQQELPSWTDIAEQTARLYERLTPRDSRTVTQP